MKNKWKKVSSSDDSECVDDPNPVQSIESINLHKSLQEKVSSDSNQKNILKRSEAESKNRSCESLKSGRNSVEKLVQNQYNSSKENNDATKKKSLGNNVTDMQATFDIKDLSSDDEVYIFHCPENFHKHDFLNKIFNISKSQQFVYTREGEKYQLDISRLENKQITLAVPEKPEVAKLFNLPLKGHIIVQKLIEIQSNIINDLNDFEDTVTFPKDIKIRHPFLGVNWKSYIDSAKEALEEKNILKKKKRKIKKEKPEGPEDVEKRKMKRKSLCEAISPKKLKRKA